MPFHGQKELTFPARYDTFKSADDGSGRDPYGRAPKGQIMKLSGKSTGSGRIPGERKYTEEVKSFRSKDRRRVFFSCVSFLCMGTHHEVLVQRNFQDKGGIFWNRKKHPCMTVTYGKAERS